MERKEVFIKEEEEESHTIEITQKASWTILKSSRSLLTTSALRETLQHDKPEN